MEKCTGSTLFGGIILINTKYSFVNGKKFGYILIPIYDLGKQYILFTNKINELLKNKKITNQINLFAVVKFINKIYNGINEVQLDHIIGTVNEPNNYYKTLLFYGPKYNIKTLKHLNNISISNDENNLLELFVKSLIVNAEAKQLYTITIDPTGCRDIDDAISYIDDNNFVVHIADPNKYNEIINLDKYYVNYTSIYFGIETYHLLPRELSTYYISLIENQIRPVISVYFEISNNEISIKQIRRQNIFIDKNMSYDEANMFNNDRVINLFNVAKQLVPHYYRENKLLIDTHDMIELFMLATNNKIAEYLINNQQNNILFKVCDENSSKYDYINTGHHKLNLNAYVHFTSPIRRTADYIIHQQIINCIQNNDKYINTFDIGDIDIYNDVLQTIKLASNRAKYVYVANLIDNGTLYKCKLLDYNQTTFKWLIINYDLKFRCELCHTDFIDKYVNIINKLKINEWYDIKLYKFDTSKTQLCKIAFEFEFDL